MKQLETESVENDTQGGNVVPDKKQYLITDEKFQLLKQCQQVVFMETESSPSIRKIINELITEENLRKVQLKFISIWSS